MTETSTAIEDLEARSTSLATQAAAITISDQETFEAAGKFLSSVKMLRREVTDTFEPIRRKAHAAWKEVVAQENRHDAPLKDAEGIVKGAIGGYVEEQERKAEAERRRLEAEARKRDDEARLAEAERLEAEGNAAAAEQALEEEPVTLPPPKVAPPKAAGVSTRKQYRATVVDLPELLAAILSGLAPLALVTIDPKVLNALANAHKEELKLPGVTVAVERIVASR